MRRLRPDQRITLETASRRALAALHESIPAPANAVADSVWPGHDMTAQGAGGAASRILKVLQDAGLVRWVTAGRGRRRTWGWVRVRGVAWEASLPGMGSASESIKIPGGGGRA